MKSNDANELRFTYNLHRGVLDSELRYGIETAASLGMSPSIINEAIRLREVLDQREATRQRKKIQRAGYALTPSDSLGSYLLMIPLRESIVDRLVALVKSNLSAEARKLYLKDLKAQYERARHLEEEALDQDTMDIETIS